MGRKRHTPEQIITALREAEVALARREDRPWPEYMRGRPITTRQVAQLLNPFGTKPKPTLIDGKTLQGYMLKDFQDAFTRYLLPFDPAQKEERNEETAPSGSNIIPISRLNHEALRRRREKAQRERRENMLI